jgi:hypothetical protein
MADGQEKEKNLVRFDLPGGLDAKSIAAAIREHGRRILDEEKAKKEQQPKKD